MPISPQSDLLRAYNFEAYLYVYTIRNSSNTQPIIIPVQPLPEKQCTTAICYLFYRTKFAISLINFVASIKLEGAMYSIIGNYRILPPKRPAWSYYKPVRL